MKRWFTKIVFYAIFLMIIKAFASIIYRDSFIEGMKKVVTRNDVAKHAKVSPAVVSYVINNSNYVSEEKRKAVLAAIKELNYIPDQNAKNLKQSRTHMIAVVRGSQMNDMFNDLLYYIENLANAQGYLAALITVAKDDAYYATDSFIDMLIGRRFDAIFIANSSLTEQQINRIAASGIKVLLYVTRSYFGLDRQVGCIVPNYRLAVKEIITKLIDLGHTRIAMLPNLMYPGVMHTSDNHRFRGYLEVFAERGLLINTQYLPKSCSTLEDAMLQVERMFDGSRAMEPPTAIYADETVVMASALKRLNAMGLRVPEDVSLVCSSNSTMATITTPQLTAVGFDPQRFAEISLQMLVDLINGEPAVTKEIDFNYYARESIAPPRARRAAGLQTH